MNRWAALFALSCAGFAVLLHVEHSRTRRAVEALRDELARGRPAAIATTTVMQPGSSSGPDADEIAARVAERLRGAPPPTGAPNHAPEPPLPDHDQQAAIDRASQRLDGAIARGRLEVEDVRAMRQDVLAANDPRFSHELARRIAQAVNLGQLHPANPLEAMP